MAIATINPASGEVVQTFDPMPPERIDESLARAEAGFATLRATSFAQRAQWMSAAADLLDAEIARWPR
jgi:succinate-semialdehyde dehydrogenase/glutarate-semialdehyde dehydrogenase